MNRYSVMERQWIAGQMQLIIMDWSHAKIITLTVDEVKTQAIEPTLKLFIEENIAILKQPYWKGKEGL